MHGSVEAIAVFPACASESFNVVNIESRQNSVIRPEAMAPIGIAVAAIVVAAILLVTISFNHKILMGRSVPPQ